MTANQIEYVLTNQEFIKQHLTNDTVKLLFKHAKDEDKKLLISQIASRQKIRKKLPDWYQNFNLVFLPGLSLEQSSSEETAKLKASLISGKKLLDITGGMGIDTYYLSESFEEAIYVEMQPELFEVSKHNLNQLAPKIEAKYGDGVELLTSSDADVVYIDPYRRDDSNRKMVSLSDCAPDVTQLLPILTKSGRTSIIKASPMLDISIALNELKHVAEIWIISVRNECKELLFVLKEGIHTPIVKTYNITLQGLQTFDYSLDEKSLPQLCEPKKYLYEPNSSILKSGGQDEVANLLQLEKLHPQSNFYTSKTLVQNFPGRTFEIVEIVTPFDKSLQKGRFNVISRNFPQKADKIEKKLKLSSSDSDFLIATKTMDDKHIFIKAKLQIPSVETR